MRRVLKIGTGDGQTFYSKEWGYNLVKELERKINEKHGGVKSMELVKMTQKQFKAIPATMVSAELFRKPWRE